jgi:DNA helicase-2/ATP-dependent DNA helicase PcrA
MIRPFSNPLRAHVDLLSELNEQQRAAAAHSDGPLLILAGAGSGKTRVITYRIAHLLAQGTRPEAIVAVTFTNKAAAEMRERVLRLLERTQAEVDRPPWLGTFHSYCLRLLRVEVSRTELSQGFVVLDQDDSRSLVKACERELGIDEKTWLPRRVHSRISRLKADCVVPDRLSDARDELDEVVSQVYPLYQKKLVETNACDFDDLLMRTVLLLEQDEDCREKYQQRVEHLLVDEYQDTNPIQYRLIRLLSGLHPNVCAVGDEDQSIYAFRGADIGNILRFEQDYPGTEVFRVERNYRSTGHVLGAANGVVSHNVARKGKVLWTENEDGEPVRIVTLSTDLDEADWVAREASRLALEFGHSEVAVAYRTNAQSRLLEQSLSRRGVPHVVIGGQRFYERREVKDALAFLRLIVNPHDDVALERVLNVPPRGIGKGAREQVRERARRDGVSLWRALHDGIHGGEFSARAERALDGFIELIEEMERDARDRSVAEILRRILELTSYDRELEKEGPEMARDRRGNLEELVSAGAEHDERGEEAGPAGFLSELALSSDTDALGQDGRVQLMTLHSAKGLEFDAVFLCGLEEELFPHANTMDDEEAIEEERRLCYVGMTRARKRLSITNALSRRIFGQPRYSLPSRFLSEIPAEHVERQGGEQAQPAQAPARGRHGVNESTRDSLASFFGGAAVEPEDESQDPDDAVAPAEDDPDEGPVYVPDEPEPEPQPVVSGPLRRGDLVKHGRFGVGTVVGLEGSGPKTKLTVYFAGKGRVKLVQAHARLQRVT